MTYLDIFLIGIGLSMDAFAVSICKGLTLNKFNAKMSFILALYFGGFQALMPLIGWYLGIQFKDIISSYDHWIAFVLLVYIGGKMIYDSFKSNESHKTDSEWSINHKELLLLAIATSIDALAAGITFSFGTISIYLAILIIGLTTFSISFIGVFTGYKFGNKFESKAELLGGIILIGIGFKILLVDLL